MNALHIAPCHTYRHGIQSIVMPDGSIASVPYMHVIGDSLQKRMKVWFFDMADMPISEAQQERLIISQMRRVGAKRAFYEVLRDTATQHTQAQQLEAA